MSTLFTETAAPMPIWAVLPTALASDIAVPSVLPLALTLSDAAVLTFRLAPMLAETPTSIMLTATAAATDTLPSLDEAEGFALEALEVEACCLLSPTLFLLCCC